MTSSRVFEGELLQAPRPTVLVTGGAGYIGSHTVLELLTNGFDVVVLDTFANSHSCVMDRLRLLAHPDLQNGAQLHLVEMDVRDQDGLEKVLLGYGVQGVIHFAGLKSVAESVEIPQTYWDVNVGGTQAVVRAMLKCGVPHMVFSSSALVYGEPEQLPLSEQARTLPVNPYGRTKIVGEQFLSDVCQAHLGFHACALRYFNPVGAHPSGQIGESPKGAPNNLMPLICQVAAGQRAKLSLFGEDYNTPDGSCIRDYLHVMDLARAHVLTLLTMMGARAGGVGLQGANVLNLGTGSGVSVKSLIAEFEAVNAVSVPFDVCARRAGDVPILVADAGLAKATLGWQTHLDVKAMCQDAWRWQQHLMSQGAQA